jgi:hypothetical protein
MIMLSSSKSIGGGPGFQKPPQNRAARETTPETERSNYFMFVGRMCTTLDPSLQGSNCPAGMISCDMLSVLCYLWIYSKLSVALSLNKTCNPHNAWSILFKWVSSHSAKGSNSDTWIRFKRLASFRKGDIF